MSVQSLQSGLDAAAAVLVEELFDRLQAGGADVDAFIAAHPEHAETLRRLLPAMRLMADLSESAADEPPSSADDPGAEPLGDFRLLREVGRGGMGIVYEAVQMSLNRRVAVKVLPLAATLDPRQLQRFRHEAQAAALLHHPNIVPVHGVGCERGVHYYAMQLIEGRSLADVIAEQRGDDDPGRAGGVNPPVSDPGGGTTPYRGVDTRRSPAPPTVAARSTKPSRTGKALYRHVAELVAQAAGALEYAHTMGVVHRDIKPANLLVDNAGHLWVTDFGLARLGDGVGLTASGDLLGTLRYMSPEQALAKHGLVDHRTDVYSLGATLYELLTLRPAVGGDDKQEVLRRIAFEEPAAPRKVDKAIPAELETVTLKALAKDPAERYATAGDLAGDLRRFLTDRPIEARRPTVTRRVSKWAGRHRTALTAAAVVLVLAAASAIGGVLWHNRQLQLAADRETGLAREALRQRDVARQAAEDMYGRVAQDWLADEPGLTHVQREFLEKAVRIFEDLAAHPDAGESAVTDQARAFRRVGEIDAKLGRHEPAVAAFDRAIALLDGEGPATPEQAAELAEAYTAKGILLSGRGQQSEAEAACRRAVALYAALPRDFAADPQRRYARASAHNDLCAVLLRTGRMAEAESVAGQAVAILRPLVAEYPGEPRYRFLLGGCLHNMAMGYALRSQPAAARPLLEEAVRHQEAAVRLRPRFAAARSYLRNHYAYLAMVLPGLDDRPAALAAARRALAEAERLAADFPDQPHYRIALADSCSDIGNLLKVTGRAEDAAEAERAHRRAVGVLEPLAAADPADRPLSGLLGTVRGELAAMLADDPACPSARAAEAVRLAEKACERLPSDAGPWLALGMAHYRADALAAAAVALDRAAGLPGGDTPGAGLYLAMARHRLGERDEARRQYDAAARRLEKQPSPEARTVRLRDESATLLGVAPGANRE